MVLVPFHSSRPQKASFIAGKATIAMHKTHHCGLLCMHVTFDPLDFEEEA